MRSQNYNIVRFPEKLTIFNQNHYLIDHGNRLIMSFLNK